MNKSLERLMRLTGWGGRSGPPYDWDRVRAELGTDLPRDYIQLVEAFGNGRFDEALFLPEPGCSRPYFDLVRVTMERRWGLRLMLKTNGATLTEDEVPSSVRPPNGDPLITWAVTDYGLDLHWRCSPWDQPDRWPVVAFVLAESWHEYDMRATEFLEGLLAGSIEHPSWDPLERHSFAPITELPGDEHEVTAATEAAAWLPDVEVRIEPTNELDPKALFGWLLVDEEVEPIKSAIGVFRSVATHYVEVTLRGHRGMPVLGRSVARWIRSANAVFTGKLTCEDSIVWLEGATPEAVEEAIRTLGTVE